MLLTLGGRGGGGGRGSKGLIRGWSSAPTSLWHGLPVSSLVVISL